MNSVGSCASAGGVGAVDPLEQASRARRRQAARSAYAGPSPRRVIQGSEPSGIRAHAGHIRRPHAHGLLAAGLLEQMALFQG